MYLIHIDESVTRVTARLSHLCVPFSKKLNRLYAKCMMHGSRNDSLKWVHQSRRDTGYYDGVARSGL
jgi:hypothetical protein